MADPEVLAQAVLTRAATAATFLSYDGLPSGKPTKGYVVHYFGVGSARSADMTGRQSDLRWTFSAVCVGYTPAQCRLVAKSYRALFLNWRPTAAAGDGWIRESEDDPPLITDSSVEGDTRHSITLRFILNTRSI